MMVSFHAKLVSPKETKTLIGDMHLVDKQLMYLAVVTRRLRKSIEDAIEELADKKTKVVEKDKIEKELWAKLEQFEQVSILKEKKEYLAAREAAEIEKRELNDMKNHIRGELSKLLALRGLPGSYKDLILEKVGKDIADIRGDITKQAEIAIQVKRGSATATLPMLKIVAPSEIAATKAGKRRAFRAEKQLNLAEHIEGELKSDESEHDIDAIKDDLIKEAHADEKVIHYVYSNLLYGLLFMSYMEKDFEDLLKLVKKRKIKKYLGKKFSGKLKNKLQEIKKEWMLYMGKIVTVLQQLRFSVAPAETGQILRKAA